MSDEVESFIDASERHDVFESEARKDIVEIDEERKAEEKTRRVAPGVFCEAIGGEEV